LWEKRKELWGKREMPKEKREEGTVLRAGKYLAHQWWEDQIGGLGVGQRAFCFPAMTASKQEICLDAHTHQACWEG